MSYVRPLGQRQGTTAMRRGRSGRGMPSTVRVLAALVAALAVVLVTASPAPARTVVKTAWEVDLGAAQHVRAVTVLARDRSRLRVQTSVDGRRFSTAARVRTRPGKRVRVRFAQRPARFVKLAGGGDRAPRVSIAATGVAPWKTGRLPAPLPASTGTKRYVALGGSDANPGTEARPWGTLQHALELAGPGEQILVRGGTYKGAAVGGDLGGAGIGNGILASPQGAPGAPITFQPYPGEKVTIVGFVSFPRAAWFRMTGFIVDGKNAPAGAEGVSLGNTSTGEPHHVELSYNEIRNFQPPQGRHAHGILHFSGTDTALIGNRIHHIGRTTFYDHGIYLKAGRRVVVANNVISDITGGYGLHIWGDFDDSFVINNSVSGSAASGFTIGGNDDRGKPDRTVAANNIFAGHGGTADSQQGYAAKEYQPGTGNSVRRNLAYGNARSSAFALSASNPSQNRTVAPGARSAAARNAGEDFGLLVDADGRPRDSRPDVGAFEAP
jgi:hypothetical protein